MVFKLDNIFINRYLFNLKNKSYVDMRLSLSVETMKMPTQKETSQLMTDRDKQAIPDKNTDSRTDKMNTLGLIKDKNVKDNIVKDILKLKKEVILFGTSLHFFDIHSRIRQGCANLSRNKRFDSFILLVIIFSSIIISLDNPMA